MDWIHAWHEPDFYPAFFTGTYYYDYPAAKRIMLQVCEITVACMLNRFAQELNFENDSSGNPGRYRRTF